MSLYPREGTEVTKEIEELQEMTLYAWTLCSYCKETPVTERDPVKLQEFVEKHLDLIQSHRELLSGSVGGDCLFPDVQLAEGPRCFIGGVCCDCCRKHFPDTLKLCREAREEYEEECRECPM